MLKLVITVVLAATQVASWSALPLYLCIDKDGSVCIDLGSESCACCGASESEPHLLPRCDCCGGSGHDHDAVGGCAGGGAEISDACGCLHFQILHQQGPVVARGKAKGDNITRADRPTPPDYGVAPRDEIVGCDCPQSRPTAHVPAGGSVNSRAPVVLRC
jgi:hypothetical protein